MDMKSPRPSSRPCREARRRSSARSTSPPGASSFSSYISKLVAEKPDVAYSTVIAEDTITLVKQAFPAGLFKATQLFGILDYGPSTRCPSHRWGRSATGYPSASIYDTPLSKKLAPLGTAVANSGAAGDGFNQIEMIAQGIEQAPLDRTDRGPQTRSRARPCRWCRAARRSTHAATSPRCRSRWARWWGRPKNCPSRTLRRSNWWIRTSTSTC